MLDLMAALTESVQQAKASRGEGTEAAVHELPEKEKAAAGKTTAKKSAKKTAAKKTTAKKSAAKKTSGRRPRSA